MNVKKIAAGFATNTITNRRINKKRGHKCPRNSLIGIKTKLRLRINSNIQKGFLEKKPRYINPISYETTNINPHLAKSKFEVTIQNHKSTPS
jgi:hypothetical protein